MVRESPRRRPRWTTLLMVLPGVLVILTLISAWLLPSSSFQSFWGPSAGQYELEAQPKISGPDQVVTPTTMAPTAADSSSVTDSSTTSGTSGGTSGATTSLTTSGTAGGSETLTLTRDPMVPPDLLELGVYEEPNDFINAAGIQPTGWETPNEDPNIWGPCRFVPTPFEPSATTASIEWRDRRRRPPLDNATTASQSPEYYRNAQVTDFDYLRKGTGSKTTNNHNHENDKPAMGGWCRPGFLIIGAGKCGTSSLYHYLVGHPRVLPAIEKQIHYFKYWTASRPLEWYYGHFPTPTSFLEHGGLVTGEASPGYLPYPQVAKNAYKAWSGTLDHNGAGMASQNKPLKQFLAHPSYRSMVPRVPPRIIALGREPLDRIYSSYKYNYVVPTLEYLRTKGHPRIRTAKANHKKKESDKKTFELNRPDDEYYLPFLFTLEDFVRAELKQLRGCLYDWGPSKTYTQWNRDAFYHQAIQDRNGDAHNGGNTTSYLIDDPPLIDLDGICYGNSVNKTVYREQWKEMQTQNPLKVLLNKNLHLTQAFIGRSLYVFPLEWWYMNFRPDPRANQGAITFVCTEDLHKVETLVNLTQILGLPAFDGFEAILAEGAYNVGGHRGYDTATSWEEVELEHQNDTQTNNSNSDSSDATPTTASTEETPMTNGIPLPEDLYWELKEFINPINERLFALTGKRCDW